MGDLQNLHIQPQQHLHVGHHGNAEAVGHEVGDDLVLLGLVGDDGPLADLLVEPVHHVPEARAGGKVDLRIGEGLLQVHRVLLGQGMVPGCDEYQVLPVHGDGGEAQLRRGLRGEDQVVLPVGKALEKVARDAGVEGEADVLPGIGGQIPCRQVRHELDPQGPQQPQADDALAPAHPLQLLHPLVQGGQGIQRAGEELLAEVGELRAPAALFKERHPQLGFQLGDGVAEAGLGDAELLCGAGIVLRSGQFHKVTKMQKIHNGHLSLFHKYYGANHRKCLWLSRKLLIC